MHWKRVCVRAWCGLIFFSFYEEEDALLITRNGKQLSARHTATPTRAGHDHSIRN